MRLLVVSHPAVVAGNQAVYLELARRGWDLSIVVPRLWRHEYSADRFAPVALEGLEDHIRPVSVALAGRPQRHFYLGRLARICDDFRPHAAFVEAEPSSIVASQWSYPLVSRRIGFGVQCYENIDRALPPLFRRLRTHVLTNAVFVAARSPSAAALVRSWGARRHVSLVPPAVPPFSSVPTHVGGHFTIGYAGRLVPSKGLDDLVAAVRFLAPPVELLLAGDGEMRGELDGQPIPGSRVRVLTGLSHHTMQRAYGEMDVLVLPSRTTATWKEQFGRVIVEALLCGVPVVGSDSGEIPWVIRQTGGGLVYPEGDVNSLAARLDELRRDPTQRRQLATRGRTAALRLFSLSAVGDALEALVTAAAASSPLAA
jgi:glycosyltransferase involved in cell wall biosynthesis